MSILHQSLWLSPSSDLVESTGYSSMGHCPKVSIATSSDALGMELYHLLDIQFKS